MSIQARQELVNKLMFQDESQKDDLLNPEVTQTDLIQLLTDLVNKGHHIVITAVKSDHHDDSNLGEHCHFNGWCVDCWANASQNPTDYLAVDDPRLLAFIKDAGLDTDTYQIGETPDAYTARMIAAANGKVFEDDGGSHIHLGSK